MRNALLLLILLSTGIGLSAQQSRPSATTTFSMPSVGMGCPVSFDAQLNSRVRMYSIADQKKYGNSPLLELTFGHSNTKILSASIIVHGLSSSNSSRYLPVSKRQGQNKTQIFKLDGASESTGLADVEVRVTKMTFVRWAEVTELRYADGSTWHPSADAQCRAVPSGFRLINLTPQ